MISSVVTESTVIRRKYTFAKKKMQSSLRLIAALRFALLVHPFTDRANKQRGCLLWIDAA